MRNPNFGGQRTNWEEITGGQSSTKYQNNGPVTRTCFCYISCGRLHKTARRERDGELSREQPLTTMFITNDSKDYYG